MIELTISPIDPHAVIESVRSNSANGAVVSFIGSLRDLSSEGIPLRCADCELAPLEMERSLRDIVEELRTGWNISDVSIAHRYGRIGTGESILAIAISAPHRLEAFEACRHAVDRIKDLHRLVEII